jgi:hypothetical protein
MISADEEEQEHHIKFPCPIPTHADQNSKPTNEIVERYLCFFTNLGTSLTIALHI